jgi:hypothetical protein
MIAEYRYELLFLTDGFGSLLLQDEGPPAVAGNLIGGNTTFHAALASYTPILPDNHAVMGFVRIFLFICAGSKYISDIRYERKDSPAGKNAGND